MLRIAVPNKGSLSEPAQDILAESGYRRRRDLKQLVLADPDNGVEFFFLRPRDIAIYVGSGSVDAGITGRDLLLDSNSAASEHLALGFARSTFRFAAVPSELNTLEQLKGLRVATSYDVLVSNYLNEHGVTPAEVVHLDGAVETAIRLGVADAIADVVETGSTLRAAGLEVFGEPLLKSEAVLIRRPGEIPDGLNVLTRRLQGVLTAQRYVLFDYDIKSDLLEQATKITPGSQSPTVSPLHDGDWVAVRSLVEKSETNKVMDELYSLGARAILVTSIHASRI